jgi:hypothetical protein
MNEQFISTDIEQLMNDLRDKRFDFERKVAAEEIGKLTYSNIQLASALVTAGNTDSSISVRKAVSVALASPVHQAVLEQNPELKKQATKIMSIPHDDPKPVEETKSGHKSAMLGGLFLIVLGIILTGISESNASDNSGSYSIYMGIILVGVITVIKGFFAWANSNNRSVRY